MKKYFTLLILFIAAKSLAQSSYSNVLLSLTDDKKTKIEQLLELNNTVKKLNVTEQYTTENGVGYDFMMPTDNENKARFISINVPDGNYKVTILLGNRKQEGHTSIRAESRRIFINNVTTKKGEFKTFNFITNKRTPKINDNEVVAIKKREQSKLNWDDKLTIEINGTQPQCAAILIERVDTVPTVFLSGNSTVVDQDNEPWASWGQMIPMFFNSNVCFANYAESGETLESFIAANRLKKILSEIKRGDYLFIEFGHNDQKLKGPGKGAYYSFATNLKIFIDEARSRGAIPVLLTPTCRRSFSGNEIQNTHGDFPDAVRQVAERENVPLIDLQRMTKTLYEALGVEQSKKAFVHYPAGTYPNQEKDLADNTHFNPYGAYEIARCVLEGIKENVPALADFLTDKTTSFNPATPDNPDSFHWDDCPFVELAKPDGN